jgi:O-antigen/teichoic acid export membrane protein
MEPARGSEHGATACARRSPKAPTFDKMTTIRTALPQSSVSKRRRWKIGSVPAFARDFGWSFLSQYGRFALQGLSFVLLARVLKADGLGLLSAIMGFVNILGPFTGWGSASLILKYLPRDRSQCSTSLGTAALYLLITGLLFTGIAGALGPAILGNAFIWPIFLAMVGSEMIILRVVDIAASTFQAVDRLDLSAKVYLLSGFLRLAAAGLCYFFGAPITVAIYSALYLLMSVIGAVITLWMMGHYLHGFGRPRFSLGHMRSNLGEGLSFSFGIASKAIYSDIDKTMLARLATMEATGLYTAAYRLTNMAFLPALSLLGANAVRLSRSSAEGIGSALRCAFKILPGLLGYALAVGVALSVAAPLIPVVLGHSYVASVVVLRSLAWMPLIQVVHYLLGDVLSGVDRQGARSLCQFGVAVLNIGLNLWLIPHHSWAGAVIATYISEGLLALAMIALVYSGWRSEKRGAGIEAAAEYCAPVAS